MFGSGREVEGLRRVLAALQAAWVPGWRGFQGCTLRCVVSTLQAGGSAGGSGGGYGSGVPRAGSLLSSRAVCSKRASRRSTFQEVLVMVMADRSGL